MADFPILKWINVDGRQVPFTYPQHKKTDGSYTETGEDNPLPTASYGMTDGGVWIPTKVNDDGSVRTQLTGSNVENIIPRGVLNSDSIINTFNSPFGVKGIIFELRVYGITGTFEADQGINLKAYGRTLDGNASVYSTTETKRTTNPTAQHYAIIHRDFNLDNYNTVGGSQFTGTAVVPNPVHRVDVRVRGTFDIGEGFDCELNAVFIY